MELNKEQIVKILEIISNSYDGNFYIISPAQMLLLTKIIKELTEEVNDLKEDNELYSVFCEDYKKQIEDLKAISEQYQKQFEDCYEEKAKLTEENKKLTINMNAYGLTAKRLGEENERLRAELEQRPPKLIITKLPKKENENVCPKSIRTKIFPRKAREKKSGGEMRYLRCEINLQMHDTSMRKVP